jgi:hypothetical protein
MSQGDRRVAHRRLLTSLKILTMLTEATEPPEPTEADVLQQSSLIGNNPFAMLTAIVAPAIMTNASSVLALGTSNRLARVIDHTGGLRRLGALCSRLNGTCGMDGPTGCTEASRQNAASGPTALLCGPWIICGVGAGVRGRVDLNLL